MQKIFIVIIAAGAASIGVGIYFWTKPVASLGKAKPDVAVTAVKLMDDYETDENVANSLYLGKIVEVTGNVKGVSGDEDRTEVILATNSILGDVSCNFESDVLSAVDGQLLIEREAVFKCECTGYLSDVVLERCVPVK